MGDHITAAASNEDGVGHLITRLTLDLVQPANTPLLSKRLARGSQNGLHQQPESSQLFWLVLKRRRGLQK